MKIIGLGLKDLIKCGVDNNVIVFDRDAEEGICSVRFLQLLLTKSLELYSSRLKEIYLPKITTFDNITTFIELAKSHNLTIHFSCNIDLLCEKYFKKELDGTLACGDDQLVVGITEDGNIILGSF